MSKKYITEEECRNELEEIKEVVKKGKEEASKMTYDEQVDFFTKFIKLSNVKKMEDK